MKNELQATYLTKYYDGREPAEYLALEEGKFTHEVLGGIERVLDLSNPADHALAQQFVADQRSWLISELQVTARALKACEEIEKALSTK